MINNRTYGSMLNTRKTFKFLLSLGAKHKMTTKPEQISALTFFQYCFPYYKTVAEDSHANATITGEERSRKHATFMEF
jgi:hypothetical protein